MRKQLVPKKESLNFPVRRLQVAIEVVRDHAESFTGTTEEWFNFVTRVIKLTEEELCPIWKQQLQPAARHFEDMRKLSSTGGVNLYVTRIGDYLLELNDNRNVGVRLLPKNLKKKSQLRINISLFLKTEPLFEAVAAF